MTKTNEKFEVATAEFPVSAQPFKDMSEAEFAAFGAGNTVFWRSMPAQELAGLVPQASLAPNEQVLEYLVSADGAPVMIADSKDAVQEWLDNHEVSLASVH